MKKLAIVAALTLATASAHAWEVSGRGVYDWSGSNASGGGVAVSNAVTLPVLGKARASVEFTRVGESPGAVNQMALVATKDLLKLPFNTTVGVRGGVAYVEPLGERHSGGAAALIGVAASVPVTKTVAVEAGIDRRFVESRPGVPDGNVGFLGLRVAF